MHAKEPVVTGLRTMKSERRHELEKNALLEWLVQFGKDVQPYQNHALLAVILVALGVVVWVWWSGAEATQSAAAWDSFHQAVMTRNPSEFERVAEEFPNSEAAKWATVMASDAHLDTGCNQLFSNKASANEELRRAIDGYKQVLDMATDPVLRERATYGLARAQEALGDLDQAAETYQSLVRTWPEGAYAPAGKQRLESLDKPSTREFYDKFAAYDPKPAYSDEPGTPGEKPAFDLDALPEEPEFNPGALMELEEEGVGAEGDASLGLGDDEESPAEPE